MPLNKKIVDEPIHYDGSQIESHWALRQFGLEGDSVVAFVGSCEVTDDKMADWEDRLAGSRIAGTKMLHIIVEHFGGDLTLATTRQRLLSAIARDLLAAGSDAMIVRTGDDLYDGPKKLSISVAVPTPVSGKIHFGINVTNEGTPVQTGALEDYNIEPFAFARQLVAAYERELNGIARATTLVRGVS